MIVDGRALARDVLARTKVRAEALGSQPHIAAVVTSETGATKSYLKIKEKRAQDAGCVLDIVRFPEHTPPDILGVMLQSLVADAILVQLPLAQGVDTRAVCDAIPLSKDADVLSTLAREQFENMDFVNPYLLPPVIGAIREIFIQNGVEMKEKKAVVVGAGFLVGAPVATWLGQQGAEVEVVTLESEKYRSLTSILKTADIIVSGAGSPHLIKPEMLKEGVILIDAGTSESNGEVVGDADPACAERCSLFTPVPGGVGPLAVACLFENAVTLAEAKLPFNRQELP